MHLTLIVAIVTSEYIFRCPKVSILIENIYISNHQKSNEVGRGHSPPTLPAPPPPTLTMLYPCFWGAMGHAVTMCTGEAKRTQSICSFFSLFELKKKHIRDFPPFHGKFLLLLLFRCLTLFTRCVPKKSRTTVTLCESLQWTTLFCTRSPLTSSTTGTVSSNAHDCDIF